MPTHNPNPPKAQDRATIDPVAELIAVFKKLSVHCDPLDVEAAAARKKLLEAATRYLREEDA